MRWLVTGPKDAERFMLAVEYRSILGGIFRIAELILLVIILVRI